MRSGRVALAVMVLGVGLFVGPFVGVAPEQASATPCAASSATSVTSVTSVAVVVDFGDGSPVSAVCVPADSSDNGAEVLAARARQLGTPAPRYASSGLLCAIDGYPTDGCGEQNGGAYAYWSYWHGTPSGWEYQNLGPGGWRVRADVVEGWRFQPNGAGTPSDPPPEGSPDASATCPPPASPTSPTSTEQPAPAPAQPAAAEAPATAASGSTSGSTASSGSTGSSGSTASTSTTVGSTSTTVGPVTTQAAVGGPVRIRSRDSHASPWPAVSAAGAIAGLGATGVVVARRRRHS